MTKQVRHIDEVSVTRDDLRGFHKEARNLILGAVEMGWRLSLRTGSGTHGAVLTAGDGSGKTIRLAKRNKPVNPGVRQLRRTVVQHGDPMRLAAAHAAVETEEYRWKSVHDQARQKVHQNGHKSEEEAAPQEVAVEPQEEPEQPQEAAPEPEPEPEPEPASEEPTIVETKPVYVRLYPSKFGGVMYESDTTLEQVWSDGHSDFKCKRCAYTKPTMRQVATHHGHKHVGQAKNQREMPIKRDKGYIEPEGNPRARHTPQPEKLSQSVQCANSRPDGVRCNHPPSFHPVPAGDTERGKCRASGCGCTKWQMPADDQPSDIVAKIRELLGADPETARLRERVSELEAQLEAAQEEVGKERKRADDLQGSLDALRDLIQSM